MENHRHKEVINETAYRYYRSDGKIPKPKNRERNRSCRCGSGKKYKKCCLGKHPRTDALTVDMGRPVVIDSLAFSKRRGVLFRSGGRAIEPLSAWFSVGYNRSGKSNKITSQVPIDPRAMFLDRTAAIQGFDLLIAIDTNTRRLKSGRKVAAAAASRFWHEYDTEWVYLVAGEPWVIEFDGHDAKQNEKIGLRRLIESVSNWLYHEDHLDRTIGIVTDHDLGNHHLYNSRELPLMPNSLFYLPSNFRLIYAFDGATTDGPLNQMMSYVDNLSKRRLEEISARE